MTLAEIYAEAELARKWCVRELDANGSVVATTSNIAGRPMLKHEAESWAMQERARYGGTRVFRAEPKGRA